MGQEVKENSFVVLQEWMITDLKLSGSELLVYAIIFGFSQTEGQTFKGSLQYLANWAQISRQGIHKILNSLINKNLIIKKELSINGVKVCEYTANTNTSCQPEFTVLTTVDGCQPQLINNKEKENSNTIINNNITLKEKDKKTRHKHGTYGRVLLTDVEYNRLLNELGEERLEKQIELLDEYIESNNNKNKYTNFNLVLRKSIKENWFNNNRSVSAQPRTKKNEPDWLENYVNKFEEGVEDL